MHSAITQHAGCRHNAPLHARVELGRSGVGYFVRNAHNRKSSTQGMADLYLQWILSELLPVQLLGDEVCFPTSVHSL